MAAAKKCMGDVPTALAAMTDSATAFQTEKSEASRVAALKAAQALVFALQTPTESIENVLFSVCIYTELPDTDYYSVSGLTARTANSLTVC